MPLPRLRKKFGLRRPLNRVKFWKFPGLTAKPPARLPPHIIYIFLSGLFILSIYNKNIIICERGQGAREGRAEPPRQRGIGEREPTSATQSGKAIKGLKFCSQDIHKLFTGYPQVIHSPARPDAQALTNMHIFNSIYNKNVLLLLQIIVVEERKISNT